MRNGYIFARMQARKSTLHRSKPITICIRQGPRTERQTGKKRALEIALQLHVSLPLPIKKIVTAQ
jgi:hypothetical protein